MDSCRLPSIPTAPCLPMSKKKMTNYKGITGYRLHTKRLHFNAEREGKELSFTRSGKYKLERNEQNAHFYDALSEAIRKDYVTQVGPLAVSTMLDYKENESPSLFDFYLTALREGFIFAESVSELIDTIARVGGRPLTKSLKENILSVNKRFFESLNVENNEEKVLAILSESYAQKKGDFRKTSATLDSFIKRHIERDKLFKENEIEYAKEVLTDWYQNLYSENALPTREEKAIFLKEKYGLYLSFPEIGYSFTLFPIPSLNRQVKEEDPKNILQMYEHFAVENELSLKRILGIDGSKNALSFFFNKLFSALHNGEGDSIVNEYLSLEQALGIQLWQGREEELRERVQSLAYVTLQLPKSPAMKQFGVSSFADYRSNIGGKIESWVSNTQRQKEGIVERLRKHINKLEEFLNTTEKIIEEEELSEEQKDSFSKNREELEELLIFARSLLTKMDPATHRLYADALHRWRSFFNAFLQKKENRAFLPFFGGAKIESKNDDESVSKEVGKIFGELRKDLDRIPEFPGEGKRRKIERYLNAPKFIKEGLSFLLDEVYQGGYRSPLSRDQHLDEEEVGSLVRKKLDILLRKYEYISSSVGRQIVEKIFDELSISRGLLKEYEDASDDEKARKRFFVSPYARGRVKVLEEGRRFSLENLARMYDLLAVRWEHYLNDENLKAEDLSAFLELEKVRVSLFIEFLTQLPSHSWEEEERLSAHEGALAYYLVKKNSFEKKDLARFSQMLLSSVSGLAKMWGKKRFKERFVLQYIASHKSTPIVIKMRDGEKPSFFFTTTKNLTTSQNAMKEYYSLKGEKDLSKNAHLLRDNKKEKMGIVSTNELLPIRAPRYYLQFLTDAFLVGNKNPKSKNHYKMNEYSLIREDTFEVKFPFKEGVRPSLKKVHTDLFVSIPITIAHKGEAQDEAKKDRLMGIDVGEYGLAYVVIDRNAHILTRGFIYDPALRKIRDHYHEIQKRQKTGVFGEMNTTLARVREQAIHSLRNRVHDIAVRYNASPVYEYSISNFETGSGRVTKIYRSVKKSDVPHENNADKTEKKNVWGSEKSVGSHLSAYATSYMCTKCKRNVYLTQNIFPSKEITNVGGNEKESRLLFKSDQGDLYGYGRLGDEKKTPILFVKKYARPPVEEIDGLDKEEKTLIIKKRGDSALFRCPFVDCGHISDADIQAAYIIALKRLARDIQGEKADSSKDFEVIEREGLIKEAVEFDLKYL